MGWERDGGRVKEYDWYSFFRLKIYGPGPGGVLIGTVFVLMIGTEC